MELSENDLKGIENLLKKKNYCSLENSNKKNLKYNELKNNPHKKKLILSYSKLKKTSKKVDVKFKFPKISLIIQSTTTPSENVDDNKNIIEKKINKGIQSDEDSSKKERSLIVQNYLDQIRRKSNNNNHNPKSSNTNLKLYGELFPGPGYYNLNKDDIGNRHNLRYKNLFINNVKKYNNLEKYFERNIGPGTYNPTENFNYISYSQNPKIYISSLERPSFINENEINKNVGPGSYEVYSSFDKKKKRLNSLSNSIKIDKNEKIKKLIENELDSNNNTNFFKKFQNIQRDEKVEINNNKYNINNPYYKINEKDILFDDIINLKIPKFNSIQMSSKNLHKNYIVNKNKLKKKSITNDNIEYNKISFPIIKKNINNI